MLDDIDHKLNNQIYKQKRSFAGTLGHEINLPDRTIHRYSANELLTMSQRKSDIIITLNERGLIPENEYKKYLLSEDSKFTPKLKL